MIQQKRIKNLQNKLMSWDCDALLIEEATNLYYLTGLQLSAGILVVHAKGAHLLVDGRYFEMCVSRSPCTVLLSEANRSALGDLLNNDCNYVQKLGFDSDSTTYQRYLDLQKIATQDKKLLKPLQNPVKQLRSIKDAGELDLLRAAGELGSKGFDYVLSLLHEGISENEAATELEIFWKRHGSKGLAFDPIIAFGANSSMPHYRAGEAKLRKGDTVLIDIGVNDRHYHSDMTRVVFFQEAHPKILEIYEIVKRAQQAALDLCRPGTTLGDLDKAARDVIVEAGYGERFTHSLGHGVGLEIHEFPTIRNASPVKDIKLERGMVITIEPGIYLPDLGGVRIEDTVAITEQGYEDLTKRSKEVRVIF